MTSEIWQEGFLGNDHAPESVKKRSQESTLPTGYRPTHSSVALFLICAALITSFFLSALGTTIVATAIPRITNEFDSVHDAVWYGSAYFIPLGAFQSSWGKLYGCCNLKFAFSAAIFFFEFGSLLCGIAPNSVTLIVGRSIAGMGAAGVGTGAFVVFAFAADPMKRPMFAAIIGITYGVASVLGPIVGGALTDKTSWRWCFYINLPIGAVALALIWLFFRDPPRSEQHSAWYKTIQRMDFVGVTITLGALTCYVLALQFGGQTQSWSSRTVVGLLVGSCTLIIVLVWWEHHAGESAMVIPRLFAKRHIHLSCLFMSSLAGSYYVVVYYFPVYFQSISNASTTVSAVRNIPLIAAVSCSMVISAVVVNKIGHAVLIMGTGAIFATGGASLLYTLDISTPSQNWIGYQILGGAGYGLALQMPIFLCQRNAEPADLPSVTATALFFSDIGGALFLSAAHAVFSNRLLESLRTMIPHVDPAVILEAGTIDVRTLFSPAEIDRIVLAHMSAIKGAFILSIAGAVCAFVATLGFKMKRLQDIGYAC